MDLAIPRLNRTEIYLNNNSYGISGPMPLQTLDGQALDATWGPFEQGDGLHDLAVTNGSEIRVYQNQGNGTVTSAPYKTFTDIDAQKILSAEMNTGIYPGVGSKSDLVTTNGAVLSVWRNDNADGFILQSSIAVSQTITSIAVGDINNDSFNDVVVAYANAAPTGYVSAYLNNGTGALNTSPVWTASTSGGHQIAIGDLGNPTDGTKNDGWNDIVVVGRYSEVRVFINQKTGSYFTTSAQQIIPNNSWSTTRKVLLADLQNTGGLSVIYAYNPGWYIGSPTNYGRVELCRHTGNPAPAPPKNLSWSGAPGQHPTFTWTASPERDILGYNVYRNSTKLNSTPVSTNSYTDYARTVPEHGGGFIDFYYAAAVDNAGQESNKSNAAMFEEGLGVEKRGGHAGNTPTQYAIADAFPNPFNPSTQINFDLPEDGSVSLNVFDVLGRKVGEIANGNFAAGYHSATWNASGVASGVYFARFTATDANGIVKFSKVSKLLLTK